MKLIGDGASPSRENGFVLPYRLKSTEELFSIDRFTIEWLVGGFNAKNAKVSAEAAKVLVEFTIVRFPIA